jgi:hypothetical protein
VEPMVWSGCSFRISSSRVRCALDSRTVSFPSAAETKLSPGMLCHSILSGLELWATLRTTSEGARPVSSMMVNAPIRYGPGETWRATPVTARRPDPAFSRARRLRPAGPSPLHRHRQAIESSSASAIFSPRSLPGLFTPASYKRAILCRMSGPIQVSPGLPGRRHVDLRSRLSWRGRCLCWAAGAAGCLPCTNRRLRSRLVLGSGRHPCNLR